MSDRNLKPHAEARVAMAIWSHEYAYEQKGGSMDFWDSRSAGQKAQCVEFVDEIWKLPRADGSTPAPQSLSAGSVEALRLVVEYDDLLKKHQGDEDVILFDSDIVEVDDAYDRMVDAARAALAKPSEPDDHVVASLPDVGDHINRLIVAIQPFVDFAQNVEYDEVLDASAWKSGIHRDSVSSWFGPSDFAYAAFAVSDTKSCIAALSSSEVEG